MTVVNDGFEDGSYDYQGEGELTCPNGWTPAWIQGPGGGVLHRPEYDLKNRQLGQTEVRTGQYAANFFTVNATHDAVLYRKFSTPNGGKVTAAVYCMNIGNKGDGHGMRLGIDPHGGEDWNAEGVVWSDWWSNYMSEWVARTWVERTCETYSQSSQITVFLHSKADYAVDCSASHWDDFEIAIEEAEEPDPEPDPDTQTFTAEIPIDVTGTLRVTYTVSVGVEGAEFIPSEQVAATGLLARLFKR